MKNEMQEKKLNQELIDEVSAGTIHVQMCFTCRGKGKAADGSRCPDCNGKGFRTR